MGSLAVLALLICRATGAEARPGALGLLAPGAPGAPAASAQTCRRDQSGIDWTLPFAAARARAETQQRLLFLKPIAFGTSADGGW